MTPLKILDVLQMPEKKIKESTADCGTCPVTMACAISQGGNGWKFSCCGSTAVETSEITYIVDCASNHFEKNEGSKSYKCPLCTGDIIEWAARGNAWNYEYVRTVHSKIPIKTRLDLWRERLPLAQEKIRLERARVGGD